MSAYLIVRAQVPESDRAAFDIWYENEHLPDAKTAFKAISATRGWCDDDAGLHIAIYEFVDLHRAREVVTSSQIKSLIAEFDRVWQERVTRSREVFEIKQIIAD